MLLAFVCRWPLKWVQPVGIGCVIFFLLFGRLGFCSPTELLEPNLIIGGNSSWVEVGISKILLQLIAYGNSKVFTFGSSEF